MGLVLLQAVLAHLGDPVACRVLSAFASWRPVPNPQVNSASCDPPALFQAMSGVSVLVLAEHKVLWMHLVTKCISSNNRMRTVEFFAVCTNKERRAFQRTTGRANLVDVGNIGRHWGRLNDLLGRNGSRLEKTHDGCVRREIETSSLWLARCGLCRNPWERMSSES